MVNMEYELLVPYQVACHKGIIDTVYYLLNLLTSASQCMALQTDFTLINCDASRLAPWIWSYVTYTDKWQEVESVLVCFGSVCASSVVPWHDRLDSTQGLQASAVKRDGSHRKWHVLFAPRPLCASGRVTAGDVTVTIAVEMFTTHKSPHVLSYNRSIIS